MKTLDYAADLNTFLAQYAYQPDLTEKLDALGDVPFDQAVLNEIVLWKVDRYVSLGKETLEDVNNLRGLQRGQHSQAAAVLTSLLATRGVDLPMASTILRFRNPQAFQIIDRHAYRAVYGRDYPLHSASKVQDKSAVYFDYVDALIDLCQDGNVEFETIDRLLYEFDKKKNGPL